MRPIHLDFSPSAVSKPQLLGTQRRLVPAACLAAALVVLGLVVWRSWELRIELRRLETLLVHNEQAIRARTATVSRAQAMVDTRLTAQQAQNWNRVARLLNTPWSLILDALEAATPADVAIVWIEPDPQQGTLRIQAEAKALNALLAYSEALSETNVFGPIALHKHETNEQDTTRPLRLTLSARLKRQAPHHNPGT